MGTRYGTTCGRTGRLEVRGWLLDEQADHSTLTQEIWGPFRPVPVKILVIGWKLQNARTISNWFWKVCTRRAARQDIVRTVVNAVGRTQLELNLNFGASAPRWPLHVSRGRALGVVNLFERGNEATARWLLSTANFTAFRGRAFLWFIWHYVLAWWETKQLRCPLGGDAQIFAPSFRDRAIQEQKYIRHWGTHRLLMSCRRKLMSKNMPHSLCGAGPDVEGVKLKGNHRDEPKAFARLHTLDVAPTCAGFIAVPKFTPLSDGVY
ncbi:hypothetical protein BC629DRAFT_1442373 [Irpex lacteus]|nr:hypothetical protein BC629DRAFT_1442373 [Irpex lacteus]